MQPQAPQQPQQGQLDWRQIAQKVAQANPGASPQVIAHAVSGFLPLMTQQAQQDWKQVQMQVLQDNAKTRALAEKDSAQAHADATQQRADAAALASQDRNAAIEEKATAAAAALEQKKTEAETNEFTRISTAYEKLNAATASNPARDTPANQALIQRLQARMGEMAGVPPDAVAKIAATKGPEQSWGSWFKETVGLGGADAAAKTPDPSKPAPVANDASSGSSEGPPVTSTALSQPTQDWVTKQMQRGVSRADIDAYLKAHPEIK